MLKNIEFVIKNPMENNQQYAFRALYHAIMNLDFKPGEQLSDTELSEALGVSRTPIREAMLRLVELKLVDVQPQKSSIVSRINLDYVDEGVFLRNLVEAAILREAIEKAAPADISALRENLSLQRLRIEEKRFNEYVELDDEFHKIIYLAAGKPRSWDAVTSITTHLNRLRRLQNLAGVSTLETGCAEHFKMYDIIISKASADVSAFVAQHITSGYKMVLPQLRIKHPEYFD